MIKHFKNKSVVNNVFHICKSILLGSTTFLLFIFIASISIAFETHYLIWYLNLYSEWFHWNYTQACLVCSRRRVHRNYTQACLMCSRRRVLRNYTQACPVCSRQRVHRNYTQTCLVCFRHRVLFPAEILKFVARIELCKWLSGGTALLREVSNGLSIRSTLRSCLRSTATRSCSLSYFSCITASS